MKLNLGRKQKGCMCVCVCVCVFVCVCVREKEIERVCDGIHFVVEKVCVIWTERVCLCVPREREREREFVDNNTRNICKLMLHQQRLLDHRLLLKLKYISPRLPSACIQH